MAECTEEDAELCLARRFLDVVDNMYDGPVPIDLLAGATATFLVSFLVQLAPQDRMIALSGVVDAAIRGFNENPVTDLLN